MRINLKRIQKPRISGILPIHNEEKYLPYLLESIKNAPFMELIVVLDRCEDRSEEIITKFKPRYPVKIHYKTWQNWVNPIAEVYEFGFSFAKGDIIYALGADCIYDKRTFNMKPFETYALVSYRCDDRDLSTVALRQNYEILLRLLFQKLVGPIWAGFFATRRQTWQQIHFQDIESKYGEHNQFIDYRNRLIKAGYKHFHDENPKNIHLRGTITKERQIRDGEARKIMRYPLWRVLLHSVLHLRPYVLLGYLRAS